MSDYAEFFLGSRPSVALYDCLDIEHPDFSQAYHIVRNAPSGLTVTDGSSVTEWVFDGNSNEIAFGDVLDMTRTTARSIFVWYATEEDGVIMVGKQASGSTPGWRFAVSEEEYGDLILSGTGGAQQVQVGMTSRPPIDGSEHCFGFTYTGSSDAAGVTMYLDGASVSKTEGTDNLTSADITNSVDLKIGRRESSGTAFPGTLRHISIWNRTLTGPEAAQVYGGGNPPDLSALSFFGDCLLWIKLDANDTAATDGVHDYSASGFDGTSNFDPTTTEADEFTYDYYPARVMPIASSDDLVQALSVTLGDVGDVIASELEAVWEANGMNTRPTLTYRAYRSDDLTAPVYGPVTLEIANVTTSREGCAFEARAPELNATRTGELYTTERFPMLRGFL